jgi:hypothetical protein
VRADSRLVVEAYPALVARRWIGQRGYKTDTAKQTLERQSAREEILRGLRSTEAKMYFGFDVHFGDPEANVFVEDRSGDQLDALLCAVQAGWAYLERDRNFGIPRDCDPLEGWIVDPRLASEDVRKSSNVLASSLVECQAADPNGQEIYQVRSLRRSRRRGRRLEQLEFVDDSPL